MKAEAEQERPPLPRRLQQFSLSLSLSLSPDSSPSSQSSLETDDSLDASRQRLSNSLLKISPARLFSSLPEPLFAGFSCIFYASSLTHTLSHSLSLHLTASSPTLITCCRPDAPAPWLQTSLEASRVPVLESASFEGSWSRSCDSRVAFFLVDFTLLTRTSRPVSLSSSLLRHWSEHPERQVTATETHTQSLLKLVVTDLLLREEEFLGSRSS